MAEILLVGGNCADSRQLYDEEVAGTGTVRCGGQTYIAYRVGEGQYVGLLPGQRPNPAAVRANEPVDQEAARAVHATGGWNELTHALGYNLQGGLHRTETIRRLIRRRR